MEKLRQILRRNQRTSNWPSSSTSDPDAIYDTYVYHEVQEQRLCGLHCINTVLQGSYYTQERLIEIASDIDREEGKLLYREGEVNLVESQNASVVGDFSIQVIERALYAYGLSVIPSSSAVLRDSDPELEDAFIIHSSDHWLCIRKVEGVWYQFDSLYPRPKFLTRVEFRSLLKSFKGEGFTSFVVRGEFPKGQQPHCFGPWFRSSYIKWSTEINRVRNRLGFRTEATGHQYVANKVADRTQPPIALPSRAQHVLPREGQQQYSNKLKVADRTQPPIALPSRDQHVLPRGGQQYSNKLMRDESEEDKFIMFVFKIDDCPNKSHRTATDWARCPYAHEHEPSRRRHPGFGYRPILCRKGSECQNGNLCEFAHNKFEVQLHPEIYRTVICDPKKCKGFGCCHAHSSAELRKSKKYGNDLHVLPRGGQQYSSKLMRDESEEDKFKMLVFKIDDCLNKSHRTAKDWAGCPYAHEHEPSRRRHPGFGYRPILCRKGSECQNGNLCDFAHNMFEVQLHPEIYRTVICDPKKCKGFGCCHAHSSAELRKSKKYGNDLLRNLRHLGEVVARAVAAKRGVEQQWDMWS